MDERAKLIGVLALGVSASILCVGVVVAVGLGREIPPGLWATLGATLGGLAGLLPAANGRSH